MLKLSAGPLTRMRAQGVRHRRAPWELGARRRAHSSASIGCLHIAEKFRHSAEFGPTSVRQFADRFDMLEERTADQWQPDHAARPFAGVSHDGQPGVRRRRGSQRCPGSDLAPARTPLAGFPRHQIRLPVVHATPKTVVPRPRPGAPIGIEGAWGKPQQRRHLAGVH